MKKRYSHSTTWTCWMCDCYGVNHCYRATSYML